MLNFSLMPDLRDGEKAVATLLAQGYTNLWLLEGGTTFWEEAGLALEK
jgi:rhodanese-related sulfurtransferase